MSKQKVLNFIAITQGYFALARLHISIFYYKTFHRKRYLEAKAKTDKIFAKYHELEERLAKDDIYR